MGRMVIDNFGGGINNWSAPWKIDPSQAVDILDADIDSNAIASVNDQKLTTDLPEICTYITKDRSVLKFNGQWFWSDNVAETGVESTLGYVGITPPATVPELSLGLRGTRFVSSYRYAVTFETDNGFESCAFFDGNKYGKITAVINALVTTATLTPGDYPKWDANGKIPPDYSYVGYTVGDRYNYNGRSYECIQSMYRDSTLPLFPPPDTDLSHWKDITGTTVSSTGYESIIIVLPQPTESIVTKINIYRTIGNGDELYLLATVPAGTTQYTDKIDDIDLLAHEPFPTTAACLPPLYVYEYGAWHQKSGKFLTGLNGVFYLAWQDRLYISEQDNIHAWNPLNYLPFDDEITAVKVEGKQAILVFTKNRSYRVTGTTPILIDNTYETTLGSITKYDLQVSQGCPNWRNTTDLRNQPMWFSYDGLCAFAPSENRESSFVKVLTEGRYKMSGQPLCCASANDTVWAFYSGYAVCFDFRFGLSITRRTVDAALAIYDPDTDRLLVQDADLNWYEIGGGDALPFTYMSPEFTPAGQLKSQRNWRRLWVDSDCEITAIPTFNGLSKDAVVITGTGRRFAYLPPGCFGNRMQVTATGTGTLRAIELETYPEAQET